MRNQNPFLHTTTFSPKHFINRRSETERIIGAVTNNRNIVLVSRKGLGKTSLIHNVFNELKDLENYKSLYVNVSSVNNMFDFVNLLINALVKNDLVKIKNKTKSILSEILIEKHINSLSNDLSFKAVIKGEQEISNYLEQIFNFLNSFDKKIVIAFGEFEIVNNCYEKQSIDFLIKLIDKSENINFIISGNNKDKLLKTLGDGGNQEIETLQLEPLEKKKYRKFIIKKFQKNKISINDESLEFILEWSRLNTYCVHQICSFIYEKNPKKVKISFVKDVIKKMLIEKSPHFSIYKKLLSQYQWKLLKSIAAEGEAKLITSSNFIQKYNLNAPSSVKTAITALIAKGLIYRENQTYQICDVFFERWLAK